MSRYTKEQLADVYNKLPKALQDAIISVDADEIIREVGEKHKLMIDKVGELADETGLVMLGFTHPKDYIQHLTERLGVQRDLAKEIAEEINSRIFFPVREHLKKIHFMEGDEEIKPIPRMRPPEPKPEEKSQPSITETANIETTRPAAPLPTPPFIPKPPAPTSPIAPPESARSIFEEKTKKEISRQPFDPYREPSG